MSCIVSVIKKATYVDKHIVVCRSENMYLKYYNVQKNKVLGKLKAKGYGSTLNSILLFICENINNVMKLTKII